jgi:hypothetical protein
VLACITVIPILLLNRLPRHLDDYLCLEQLAKAKENASSLVLCANLSTLLSLELQRHNEIPENRLIQLQENLVSTGVSLYNHWENLQCLSRAIIMIKLVLHSLCAI